MKKYFKTLGLEKDATQEQIQEAYERLSKELDPANNDNQEFFVEEFALLKEAYKAITGKEPNSQTTIDTKAADVSDLFEDSDSILSILKKFKGSEDAKKLEIIKSLEAFKNGNKTYQQALAMVYKKEDIDGLRATVKKEKSPKSEVNNENSNNNDDEDLTKKPFQKYSKKNIKLHFVFNETKGFGEMHLNGINVEDEIRKLEVSQLVSQVSTISEVRKKLVEQQQEMGVKKGVVMDGRDIGTVVFPNAKVKLFMTASADKRAKRRYKELLDRGDEGVTYERVLKNVESRDYIDSTRLDSPLKKAADAIEIDNSDMGLEEQFGRIMSLISTRI